jgi:hypothetical protein
MAPYTQHNDTRHINIQPNDTQHNDIQHNDIQHYHKYNAILSIMADHNDIQNNGIQHNHKYNVIISKMKLCILTITVMLSATYNECHIEPFTLSVFMPNIIMLRIIMLRIIMRVSLCWVSWHREYLVSMKQFFQLSVTSRQPETSCSIQKYIFVH